MPSKLPLIPQDNLPYHLIDPYSWNRQDSFDFFMSCGTQLHMSASIPFAALNDYLKEHQLRRFSTILYLVWRCANETQEMRISAVHHPGKNDPRVPVLFHELNLAFPVLDSKEDPKNVITKLDQAFSSSYQRITEAIEEVRLSSRDNVFTDSSPCLLVSTVPYGFDDFQMTSIHRHMLIPTVIVGSPHMRNNIESLPVSLSIHHAFADGITMATFFKKLEAYFLNPTKALGA